MKHLPIAVLTALALVLTVFATPANADHEGAVYTATLEELNDSGASGVARVEVADDGLTMTVVVSASGLNLDGPHAMHLHGIVEGNVASASFCPSTAEDANGDGIVTVLEGAVKYGGVQLSLTTTGDTSTDSALAIDRYPAGTTVSYSRSGIPIPENLRPNLSKLHVVIHGIDENGNGTLDLDQAERSSLTDDLPREGTAPALCGTFATTATGAIQTGAGGAATRSALPANDATNPLVFVAAIGAGMLALAVAAESLSTRSQAELSCAKSLD